MEKIKVEERVEIKFSDCDGLTIQEAISLLKEKEQELLSRGVEDIKINFDISPFYDGILDDSTIWGLREETDDEYLRRLEVKEVEWMQYQTLKAKFKK